MSNFWGPFFDLFGVKQIFFNFFENTVASALKSYITPFLQIFFLKIFWTWKSEKTGFFRAKIWVKFECKYMKVGNRLLLAILWLEDPLYLFWEAWGFSYY